MIWPKQVAKKLHFGEKHKAAKNPFFNLHIKHCLNSLSFHSCFHKVFWMARSFLSETTLGSENFLKR